MESAAAVNIFPRSVESYGLRYIKYFGDGDSSSFSAIENIYPFAVCKIYECLGHCQKRVGNRLRKLRQRIKSLGGKAKVKDVLHTTADGKVTKTKQKAREKHTDAAIDVAKLFWHRTVAELRNKLLASFFISLRLRSITIIRTFQQLVTVGANFKEIR